LHTQDVVAKDVALMEMVRHLETYRDTLEMELLKTNTLIESMHKCMSDKSPIGSEIRARVGEALAAGSDSSEETGNE
jgi:hypothetical protein